MGSDGSHTFRLTDNPGFDSSPRWSPDGKRIAFVRIPQVSFVGSEAGIYVINADGSGESRIVAEPSVAQPTWSPDGRSIAFTSMFSGQQGPRADISRVNSDGSGRTRLTDSPTSDISADWSPDGSRIVFVSDRDGNLEIYTMNSDGSDPARLTDSPLQDRDPAWYR